MVADVVDLEVPPNVNLSGVKLSSMTQSLAYRAIISTKMCAHPPSVLSLLDECRGDIERAFGRTG